MLEALGDKLEALRALFQTSGLHLEALEIKLVSIIS